jgi:hypothetical protein
MRHLTELLYVKRCHVDARSAIFDLSAKDRALEPGPDKYAQNQIEHTPRGYALIEDLL